MEKERYEHLLHEHSNIVGIYVHLDDLCRAIEEQVDLIDHQLKAFSFFDRHQKSTKDLSKQSAEFLWFQLFSHVISRFPENQEAKQEMIRTCKVYYRGNSKEYLNIDDFEQHYQPDDAIRWYSKQSFVYQLVNKALRTEDIDQLYVFRFFICDLSRSLKKEHAKTLVSGEEKLTVYRGGKLDREEFDKLQPNQGKLISTNGFLSASRDRSKALAFATTPTKQSNVVSVLFQIECNVKQVGEAVAFADIEHLSVFPGEKEVLFNMNACFIIDSIENDGPLQLIQMTLSAEGSEIAQNFIDEQPVPLDDKNDMTVVFGALLCDLGEYDKLQKYFEQLLSDFNDVRSLWVEFYLGNTHLHKCQWTEAHKYYHLTLGRMMNCDPPRIEDTSIVLSSIGITYARQGNEEEALKYFQQALAILEQCYQRYYPRMVDVLRNIGILYEVKDKDGEALQYFQRALKIQEEKYPAFHSDTACTLEKFGDIYEKQQKYEDALEYHHRALEMRERHYPAGHPDIGRNLYDIANIYEQQEEFDQALKYYRLALEMREKCYPSGHSAIALSLNDMARIYGRQGKYEEALTCYQRALQMREQCFPPGDPHIAQSLNSIGSVYKKEEKYEEALDYYRRALEMLEKSFPNGHSYTVQVLKDIGDIHEQQQKHNEAVSYF